MRDASNANPQSDTTSHNLRKDEVAARILRRWRELTGGKRTRDEDRRTLVACSAGADSIALAVALAQIPGSCVIAHVRHDIREIAETDLDVEHARALAQRFEVPFISRDIRVADLGGNLEANAREHRYRALRQMAAEHGCPYIATGHHADDQLETLLLHLMRGSGIRAMGGMGPSSACGQHTLIRPMLDIARDDLVAFLARIGITWREDPTNSDTGLARNRVRHELVPVMRSIDPEIASHASSWASDLAQAGALIDDQLNALFDQAEQIKAGFAWDRDVLRHAPGLLLGLIPRRVCERQGDRKGVDAMTRRSISTWIRSVKSDSTDPTIHRVGPIVSNIDAHRVVVTRADIDIPDTEEASP